MSYTLVYTKRAARDIRKLPLEIKPHLGKKLLQYAQNPLYYAKPLVNTDLGSYRFRIGDYRVIFDLENSDIVVLRVGHRKEIYRG